MVQMSVALYVTVRAPFVMCNDVTLGMKVKHSMPAVTLSVSSQGLNILILTSLVHFEGTKTDKTTFLFTLIILYGKYIHHQFE